MKRVIPAATLAVSVIALAGPAEAGGSLSGSTSHGSATVTVQDVVFDGPDCAKTPISVTYSKTATEADSIFLTIEVQASQQGSNDPMEASAYAFSDDPASGTSLTEFCVYPGRFPDAAGAINVTGSLTSKYYVNDSVQTVNLAPATTLTLVKNPTTMSPPRIKKSAWSSEARNVSGKVTAMTRTKGVIGADGTIEIYAKYPGSKRWVRGTTTSPDDFGNWSADVGNVPKGTQLRVALLNCGWCTNVEKTVKVTK